ncbi:hypothetical protein BDV27DRAFT_166199 [Aspergillus caelatus]|uniref:Major facilitator superfamily domain-containing protein n=1 Tax=Aspergillus caelatus TaxID=61420 RepID=A0A5N6ZYK0_9EURO|nr:uncharacterized protein BDV27DRAFT_166199 [Aspergillus caelatus]KAE8362495.1 hypothetical protein BDV27DRAFT_166199 [Aspergillus caelatus]
MASIKQSTELVEDAKPTSVTEAIAGDTTQKRVIQTLLFLCSFLDRTNVGNAKILGLEDDLNITGHQYDIGLAVFYLTYICSELPSNLILKKASPKIWLPLLTMVWGVVTMCLGFVRNFAGFVAVRAILGVAEGGLLPGMVLYLSFFYRRGDLALRIGLFYTAASLSGAFGVFVAFISDRLKLRGPIMLFTLPISIAGYAAIANIQSAKIKYGMTFLMATGMYSSVPCILVWNTNNSAGHYKRATTSAMQLTIANCGGFVATFNYPDKDKPQYHRGHTIILGLLVFAWFMYGDYPVYPEEPTVGTSAYESSLYDTWDPNWRGFIGTAFIIALEEFHHLVNPDVAELMLESLYNCTIGDAYRVGGVDGDNLYPSYTNPALMRAIVSGWTGEKYADANMTLAGENYANEVIGLFDRANTLSEFNSATYTGVSLIALTMWTKYAAESSVMKAKGKEILQATWNNIGQLYHAELKNLAGPWDRSYGFDMQKYFGIMSAHIWTLVGKKKSPVIDKVYMMSHNADFAISPLVAILSSFHNSLVPATAVDALRTFPGEHMASTSAQSIPYDYFPRNISAWLGEKISVGAESFNETVIGGPAMNPSTFNSAVVQWDTGAGIGWITLYATEQALDAVVGPGYLNLTYPQGTSCSQFQFLVSPFTQKKDVAGWEDLVGLNVRVSGTFDPKLSVSYSASDTTINDFMYWNLTYSMPVNSTTIPNILLEVNLA